jgi:predicted component of type VI protein secretion system
MSSLRLVPPVGGPIEIAGERTLLGRDPGADLVVNDPSVSRRHALIERRSEGWVVVDQRSANGTFINNQRVDQAVLQSGYQLRVGAVTFEVRLPGPGATAAAPVAASRAPSAPAPVAPVYTPPAAPPAPAYSGPAPANAAPPAFAPPAPGAAMVTPQPGPLLGGPAAPSFVPLTPAAPRAPGPPPAAAAPAPGAMSPAEAAELIGLWPGSPPDEVRKRYQKLYNDFQIRLTNAPTPALKKMYQRNMQDLKIACEVIAPGAIG